MNEEVFEEIAQAYVRESHEARKIMDVIGTDNETYHLTVGRRSAYLMLADKFGRTVDLLARCRQIERGI